VMSPAGLLHPSILARVLWGNVGWRTHASAPGSLERAG
jgi:hypothetical protein